MALRNMDPHVSHRLLAPRIAYLVGTISRQRVPNLIPVSNVTPISGNPKLILVAIYRQWQTYQNLCEAEGFTLSVPTADQLTGVWKLGEKYSHFRVPRGQSKLRACGLGIEHPPNWHGPVLRESAGALNCDLLRQIDSPGDHGMFVGSVRDALFNDALSNSDGTPQRNSYPLMQVTGNIFATSGDHWSIDYY